MWAMNRKSIFPLTLSLLAAGWLLVVASLLTGPALASNTSAPLAQFTYIPTPTPGPDGRIIYIVQSGDSAWSIAARYGFTGDRYNELKALNKWGDNPVLNVGDEVILGYAGPVEPVTTAGPTATPQPLLPTPSPLPGTGELCIMLYDDVNGDSLRQELEVAVAGVQISIDSRFSTVDKIGLTLAGEEPVCFEELPEGSYIISLATPDGYNETTSMSTEITLRAGDITTLDFGVQANSQTVVETPAEDPQAKSPLLMIVGIVILLVGGALGLFGGRLLSLRSKISAK